MRLLDYKER